MIVCQAVKNFFINKEKNMSNENITKSTKICPTCGTRLNENATRCLVCGKTFSETETTKADNKNKVQGPKMPEITLSLPLALGLMAIILAIGAAIVFFCTAVSGRRGSDCRS